MSFAYPIALLWVDLETTGLEVVTKSRQDQVIEVAAMVTTFDLDPIAGYHDVVRLTKTGVERIKSNEYVLNMHKKNGLLRDAATTKNTLAEVEENILNMLAINTTFNKGELMLAGSGVGHFDNAIIREQMPRLAEWLNYALFDIGVYRRMTKIFAQKDIVNPTAASYGDVKLHRAWEDVVGHVEESKKYMDLFRETF
jgi:Oligoribonuclease (3''->5'' exoribonuclease)